MGYFGIIFVSVFNDMYLYPSLLTTCLLRLPRGRRGGGVPPFADLNNTEYTANLQYIHKDYIIIKVVKAI